uniref:Uncharacterized protein n=1 Tax=Sexangularia sp. CB-2014 TaxID=1486929 RepID=A0A7S1VQ13_9EUKA
MSVMFTSAEKICGCLCTVVEYEVIDHETMLEVHSAENTGCCCGSVVHSHSLLAKDKVSSFSYGTTSLSCIQMIKRYLNCGCLPCCANSKEIAILSSSVDCTVATIKPKDVQKFREYMVEMLQRNATMKR